MMDERMELIWARVGLPATTLKSRLREAPLYFNDRQLTAEQRARWPWAGKVAMVIRRCLPDCWMGNLRWTARRRAVSTDRGMPLLKRTGRLRCKSPTHT